MDSRCHIDLSGIVEEVKAQYDAIAARSLEEAEAYSRSQVGSQGAGWDKRKHGAGGRAARAGRHGACELSPCPGQQEKRRPQYMSFRRSESAYQYQGSPTSRTWRGRGRWQRGGLQR